MEERKTVVEYVKPAEKPRSNTLAGVAAVLGGGGLALAAGNAIGTMFNRNFGGGTGVINGAAPIVVAPPHTNTIAEINCGFVTEKELSLVREMTSSNAAKDSEIAQLKAEKYADNKVQEAVDKVRAEYGSQIAYLNGRVCTLEKEAAVNEVSLNDYKRFADRVFVHQPIAKMTDCIVTTQPGCCCPCAPIAPPSA